MMKTKHQSSALPTQTLASPHAPTRWEAGEMKKSNASHLPATVAAVAALCLGSAHAASVLYVTDGSPTPTKDIRDVLTNVGHTVTNFDSATYGWDLGLNNGVTYANGFDLIVHSRNVDNVYLSVRGQGAVWNALTTPTINFDMFLTGGEFGADSWSWGSPVNSGNPGGTASGDTYTVTAPSDPILAGVTLTGGLTPALLNGNGLYWDLGATGVPLANVTVIAHQTGNTTKVAIAYAAPGALRTGSAAQYFMVGGTSGASDNNIFTADGEKVFLNAVNTLVPEPSSCLMGLLGSVLLFRRRRA